MQGAVLKLEHCRVGFVLMAKFDKDRLLVAGGGVAGFFQSGSDGVQALKFHAGFVGLNESQQEGDLLRKTVQPNREIKTAARRLDPLRIHELLSTRFSDWRRPDGLAVP